jgi:hypothetical protein
MIKSIIMVEWLEIALMVENNLKKIFWILIFMFDYKYK